ncbi:MAG TPA: CcmD family protein [Vicinamibacteria bacterium]|jgi:CcmD family protein|nr:CcmD family protein [Vicinamibacteria bacterium]
MSYLFAAYMVIWIALFTYILSLSKRQKRLHREIETLRRILEEKK